jgi:hypothetical protein
MLPTYQQKPTDRVGHTVFCRCCPCCPSCCSHESCLASCSLTPYPVSLAFSFSCSSRSLWLLLCALLGANEGLGDVHALPETRRRGCFWLPASQPGLYWRCKCTPLCHSWCCRSKCTTCSIRIRHSSSSPHIRTTTCSCTKMCYTRLTHCHARMLART